MATEDVPKARPRQTAERALAVARATGEAMGKRVLGEPRIGAHGTLIFFVHPKDMGGVLTEIMETPKHSG